MGQVAAVPLLRATEFPGRPRLRAEDNRDTVASAIARLGRLAVMNDYEPSISSKINTKLLSASWWFWWRLSGLFS